MLSELQDDGAVGGLRVLRPKLEQQPESSLITSASPALCTRGRFLLLRVRARVGVALRYAYRHNHRVAVIVTHA